MNKINFMVQYAGINLVDVNYKSGARRIVGLGNSYYMFTKTQVDFMDNATVYEIPNMAKYWISKETNPILEDYIVRNGGELLIERR